MQISILCKCVVLYKHTHIHIKQLSEKQRYRRLLKENPVKYYFHEMILRRESAFLFYFPNYLHYRSFNLEQEFTVQNNDCLKCLGHKISLLGKT